MDFLPLIIAIIIAPVIVYFAYKYVDNSKDDIKPKKSFKPFSFISDKKFDFLYKIYKTSTTSIGTIFFSFIAIYSYYTENGLHLVWGVIALINFILFIYMWRKYRNP